MSTDQAGSVDVDVKESGQRGQGFAFRKNYKAGADSVPQLVEQSRWRGGFVVEVGREFVS